MLSRADRPVVDAAGGGPCGHTDVARDSGRTGASFRFLQVHAAYIDHGLHVGPTRTVRHARWSPMGGLLAFVDLVSGQNLVSATEFWTWIRCLRLLVLGLASSSG